MFLVGFRVFVLRLRLVGDTKVGSGRVVGNRLTSR
jgi:hypothetical protein